MSRIILGRSQYGKAEVHLVKVDRAQAVHTITDLTVTCQLRGDLTAAHTVGDNAHLVATDTQKNTIHAFAREHPVTPIEDFGQRLARHFTDRFDWISGARVEIRQHGWDRIDVGGRPHDHAFVRGGTETRNTVVTVAEGGTWIVSGLTDLTVLKSTGSEFRGYPRDEYTTLPEASDRILATAVTARWRYATPDVDFDATFAAVRSTLLGTFASEYSLSLQHSLFLMASAVLEAHPEVAEIRLSMPNKHHNLVDLGPFGLDNPNVVFHAQDRPYGLIEAAVLQQDAPDAGPAWDATPGFC